MNEATLELLSRYLDGDLPADEARRLEERISAEPELRAELESMANLRRAVRSLASQEEPPSELETLVEPLRRSVPAPHGLRPAFRWLAAAATVVLGVGVAIQIVRQNPAPTLPSAARAVQPNGAGASEDGYYQLKPLPTRSPDEGDELVSAADHLLASPLPVPELEAARPMEVIGPLESPQPGRAAEVAAAGEEAVVERKRAQAARPEQEARDREETRPSAEADASWAPAPGEGGAPPQPRLGATQRGSRSREAPARAAEPDTGPGSAVPAAQLLLRVGDEIRVAVHVSSSQLEGGTYHLQLTVVRGQIRACRGDGELEQRLAREACDAIQRVVLGGIDDGQHRAELVVP